MPMSASVVCNNILTRAFQENIPVSPMKLQKLMYFVSCEYVKATGKDLLSENFGVWQYGPVLPSLYDEFKSFTISPSPNMQRMPTASPMQSMKIPPPI